MVGSPSYNYVRLASARGRGASSRRAGDQVHVVSNRQKSPTAPLDQFRPMLVQALKGAAPADDADMYRTLRYHMGWCDPEGNPADASFGKALRPLLCLFMCQAVGGRVEQALPAAVALELIHNFSLIHDDIQDEDQERRHRPTVWVLWGRNKALVSGNALRLVADRAMERLSAAGVRDDRALGAARYLTGRYLEMIEGQYLDLSYERQSNITMGDYLDMVGRKTGALIEAAMYLGAYLGTEDDQQVEALRRCGRLLGLAFQARDDVLGIWGDADVMGKATGADLKKQKRSLPVVFGLQSARGRDRERLVAIASGPPPNGAQVEEALSILDGVGAREYSQALAEEKAADAMSIARGAGLTPQVLQDL
ncbi:MAG: polyprenyl synthetase family protein, partial [SAR202 cluster bacterium]|nr:polyprenyl synthetase family protein [SAR202 cluster bacterium]